MPFKSASRLFVMVMMLLATALQVGAQETKMYFVIPRTEDVATFYYDNLYEEWRNKGKVTVSDDIRNFRLYGKNSITKIIFDISFANARPTSTSSWFDGREVLKEIIGLENLNTSNVTDMSLMFYRCSGLTSIDVSNFNTSNVTNIWGMFIGCEALTNLDVSKFNTSKVTNMGSMFSDCKALANLDVSNFNTSNVTDMGSMFSGCEALKKLDVSKFNTSNVTDMGSMFSGCKALTNLDVSKFNTSNVTDMSFMFNGCEAFTNLYVSNFNTSNVTNMGGMFSGCKALTNLDVSNFNTSNITDMSYIFNGCEALTNLDVSNFNTSKVTNMYCLFARCSSLTSLDVSNFNTENVTTMFNMFDYCSGLTSIDVSKFNTSKVTNMGQMFLRCEKLTHINLKSFDTGNVTNMNFMFGWCSALESIYIGEKVTQMPSFSDSEKLKKIVSYQKEPYAIASDRFRNIVKENAKLYVPNSTRTIYTNIDGWKDFTHIVSKDLEPKDDENAGFGKDDIDENTDLDGNIVNDIFFIVPSEAGEYDAAENCIILKKATTDEQVKNIFGLDMFDEYLVNNFIGMIFMVDTGSGTIELEAETVGEMQLNVMVGTAKPITKQTNGKSKVSIPYDVAEPTLVYVYGSMPAAQSAKGIHKANAAENALKIYSMAWGKATGIRSAHSENSSEAIIYNLNGQRVKTPGKGLYIVNGKKVILK